MNARLTLPILCLVGTLCPVTSGQTIQQMINAANPGDVVIVPNGTYTGPGNRNLDFGGKIITLKSAGGPANCIIDVQQVGRGFIFQTGETNAAKVIGFTIRNGRPNFVNHAVNGGGAIACFGASPTIKRCLLVNNSTDAGSLGFGGAVYLNSSSAKFVRCVISGNSADAGGLPAVGVGGAVYATGSTDATFRSCCIVCNTATIGGGVQVTGASLPYFQNCTIGLNFASSDGGGVSTATFGPNGATLYNSIVWGNLDPGGSSNIRDLTGLVTATWSDIEGGWPGTGNKNVDPKFVDPANCIVHLRRNSPAINMGDPSFVGLPGEKDIDGEQRVWRVVDMGCDEVLPRPIPPQQGP